jgi:AcrR family transcriptional regulator
MPKPVGEQLAEGAPRQRVLATATRLFYSEGVHAVGIDRIIAESRVAKATFYKHFPSKDELVRAYVVDQDELGRAAVNALPTEPPLSMVFTIIERLAEASRQPGYRGCPFLNAAAEYPDPSSPVRKAVDDHRRWNREHLRGLLTDAGQPDPDSTADILLLLCDGVLVSGELDKQSNLPALTRAAVNRILMIKE